MSPHDPYAETDEWPTPVPPAQISTERDFPCCEVRRDDAGDTDRTRAAWRIQRIAELTHERDEARAKVTAATALERRLWAESGDPRTSESIRVIYRHICAQFREALSAGRTEPEAPQECAGVRVVGQMSAMICDQEGWVRSGTWHWGTDYKCTGSVHPPLDSPLWPGCEIRCANPIHVVTETGGVWFPATLNAPTPAPFTRYSGSAGSKVDAALGGVGRGGDGTGSGRAEP